MTAQDCIQYISPMTKASLVQDCINNMIDNLCFELPVLEAGKIIGKVNFEDCLNTKDKQIENLVSPGCATVHSLTHIFDIMRVFDETNASVCAVMNDEFEFQGIITSHAVLTAISKSLTTEQQGAIVVIEMATQQYSSSEICRIIEGEGVQLLGLWLENVPDSGRIRASLKLNTNNAERVISSLNRFKYEVIAAFGDDDYKENVERRFQSLMKYLDI